MGNLVEFLPVDWVMDKVKNTNQGRAPLNELGEFVYTRTYSRWLNNVGRRERWHETVKRVVEYSMSLEYKHRVDNGLVVDMGMLQEEAKLMFDNVYNARQMPSGKIFASR